MVKRAYYKFVPIWFDEDTCEVVARSLFLGMILDFVLWIDMDIRRIIEFEILIERNDGENS